MQTGAGLSDEKALKRIGDGSRWLVDGEKVLLVAKASSLRPIMDTLVVTNARIIGTLGVALKASVAFRDLESIQCDPSARTVVVNAADGSSVMFKKLAGEDMALVERVTRAAGQDVSDQVVADALDDHIANDPRRQTEEGPLSQMPKKAQDKIAATLSPGERVHLAVNGAYGALVATDRRVVIAKWGVTIGSFFSNQANSWELRNITGVELRKGVATRSIVIQSAGVVPVTKFGAFDKGPGSVAEAPNAISASGKAVADDRGEVDLDTAVAMLRDMVLEGQRAAHGTTAAASQHPSLADQIRDLGRLRDEGLLTDAEFIAKKQALLGM